jgi:flavin reductase (DIM6/NTAB) family NADH-FMN oxidoreductase RutF
MKSLNYTQIQPFSIEGNLIKMIASDWMLVTAGDKQKFNTMTANWGGAGYLWNKPVVFVFVRPERYTYQFMESSDGFTLSIFDETYRAALNLCGSKSGRDCDKVAEAGLTPHFTELGYPVFREAALVLECRKLFAHTLTKNDFLDNEPLKTHYSTKGGIHKMYIAEIVKVWVK